MFVIYLKEHIITKMFFTKISAMLYEYSEKHVIFIMKLKKQGLFMKILTLENFGMALSLVCHSFPGDNRRPLGQSQL